MKIKRSFFNEREEEEIYKRKNLKESKEKEGTFWKSQRGSEIEGNV